MGEYRPSDQAEVELDHIWLYIAQDSGSIERAKIIDNITARLWFLAAHPYAGRSRDHDLEPGLRSFAVGKYVIIYQIEADDVIGILHVIDGRRDVTAVFHESDEE